VRQGVDLDILLGAVQRIQGAGELMSQLKLLQFWDALSALSLVTRLACVACGLDGVAVFDVFSSSNLLT
jgi:hypothetical protein